MKVRIIKSKKEITIPVCRVKFAIQDGMIDQILKSEGEKMNVFLILETFEVVR